jgi:hypothetical protein
MPFTPRPFKTLTQAGIDARIRRLAAREGYRALKSRWRAGSVDNLGGWQIVNQHNFIEAGERFDLSDAEALAWLTAEVMR